MKILLTLFNLLLLFQFAISQSLHIKDFKKLYNYSNPDDHSYLLKKAFLLSTDTTSARKENEFGKTYSYLFKKLNPKEVLSVSYSRHNEGGYNFEINYYVASEAAYKKFITSLKKTKFKFSKRRQLYAIFHSSYSGETLHPKGQTNIEGNKYYRIQYNAYEGKELSIPVGPILQADTSNATIKL